jgi:hypothetical protein
MKTAIGMCLMGAVLLCGARAQDQSKPVLRQGVSVQMAVAEHAVEVRAADEADATVVAITQAGKVYVGIKPAETAALSDLRDGTVYVKADARAPYQKILAVLDALRGKTVVLLTQPAGNAAKPQAIAWPHGVTLAMSR